MRTLLALGLGAAAYSLRDRKNRKRLMNMMRPIADIVPKQTAKVRKRITKLM